MSEDASISEIEQANCPMCNYKQNCDVLSRLQKSWSGHGGTYSILECRGCNQVFYRTISWNEDDFDIWNDDNGEPVSNLNYSETIYPLGAMVPAGDADTSRSKVAKGGRSPAADWEAVMVEMARALYCGDLKPKVQADIEGAIADYLSREGKHLSESTIRDHARPLWQSIDTRDGN